ncbi:ribonuclease III [Mycobacterium mantenii]|uniref:ribonuclease III n=1 Tax=Mycobacterium mantenii TaxID=560555 RepID=UPI0023E0CF1C
MGQAFGHVQHRGRRATGGAVSARQALLDALGVELSDEVLSLALTHRSYAYEHGGLPTNERLEFLGDAVLGLMITDELYHRHPDRTEGDLAKLRASVVNTQALAAVARKLCDGGLGGHLLLGRGEANTGGADKSSILADGMESLLGAIYLDHGIDVAREVILRLFGPLLDAAPTLGAGLDWKTSLQELTAARGMGAPSYVVTSTGPDHDKEFTAVVVVADTEYGTGMGRSKKEAEQKAAAATWKTLDVLDTAGKTSV